MAISTSLHTVRAAAAAVAAAAAGAGAAVPALYSEGYDSKQQSVRVLPMLCVQMDCMLQSGSSVFPVRLFVMQQ